MQLEENFKKAGFSILEGNIASILENVKISFDSPNVGAYEKKEDYYWKITNLLK